MKTLIVIIFWISNLAQAALPEKLVVDGFDVRNKNEKYRLVIGKENIILEERPFHLYRITSQNKAQLVKSGEAVYSGADLKNDTEAIYNNDQTQIKVGRLVESFKPGRQIIVLKMKETDQAFVFEHYRSK
jgi:hypothetical protein